MVEPTGDHQEGDVGTLRSWRQIVGGFPMQLSSDLQHTADETEVETMCLAVAAAVNV